MATIVEIPLIAAPQTFNVPLGGNTYEFRIYWLEKMAQCWQLDISDSSGNLLIAGVPMLTGANLLAQHAYLSFPGQLWIGVDYDPTGEPTRANLGINSHLYFVTP